MQKQIKLILGMNKLTPVDFPLTAQVKNTIMKTKRTCEMSYYNNPTFY